MVRAVQRLKSIFLSVIGAIFVFGFYASAFDDGQPIKVKAPPASKAVTPFTLFFDPEKNGVMLEKQQIDYDLSNENALRVGPYFLNGSDVAMYLTKEHGEFFEIDFGFEARRRIGPMYVTSFKWPVDYLDNGLIELQDDKGEVLWKRLVTDKDISAWKSLLEEEKNNVKMTKERLAKMLEARKGKGKGIPEKLDINRPDSVNPLHSRSAFGFAYRGVYELPINQIVVPFRFCLSKDVDDGRVGLCSKRYQFFREYGNYGIKSVSADVRPRVLVNDKPVTMKGTAVFLDYQTPIKFAALLKNGTYFEFVARPKEIHLVDIIENKADKKVEITGYGDVPLGDVEKDFFQENIFLAFLNFMPTIGDMRKFWRITVPSANPTIYLKGVGGVPFRQSFVYRGLPSTLSRMELEEKTQKATYSSSPNLSGVTSAEVKFADNEGRVKKSAPTSFEWDFRAPQKGQMNVDDVEIAEGTQKFKASYQIFRGFPAEISARLTGVLSTDLDLIVLGEIAGQYWFEKVLGWDNYYWSKLRWGMSAKYFDTVIVKEPEHKGFLGISVANVDLKYRFQPGIWARDPSVGVIFASQNVSYDFKQSDIDFTSKATFLGGGLFWARSMPSFFDRAFNIIPFLRYPKWVDVEGILYPISVNPGQTSRFTLAVNFHGKIQWTPSFFGEAGFGLKNFAWDDTTIGDSGKAVGLAVGYATIGLGFNF